MANKKSQHYVPKCHLRPFQSELSTKTIHLINLKNNLSIQNISIKNQCAKDYFYGKDLKLEDAFGSGEGIYAKIIKENKFDNERLNFLREFCYLQYIRTDIALKRQRFAMDDMAGLAYEFNEEGIPDFPLDTNTSIANNYLAGKGKLDDLKLCILKNNTKVKFLTSDDPVIKINKLYAQKYKAATKSYGLGNAAYAF